MQSVVVENEAELLALFRSRIAELNTTYEAVGSYAGLGDSYVAKILSPSRDPPTWQ